MTAIETKPDTYDALKTERAIRAEVQTASVALGEAQSRMASADQTIRRLTAAIEAHREAEIRGEPGAGKRRAEDTAELQQQIGARQEAQATVEAAARVKRSAEARLDQLYRTELQAFLPHAEKDVAAVLDMGRKLAPLLSRYIELWDTARRRFTVLRPAIEEHIDQVVDKEHEPRLYRDLPAIKRDADLPECPLRAAAVQLVQTVAPRPAVFQPGYRPPIDDDGIEVINVDLRTRMK